MKILFKGGLFNVGKFAVLFVFSSLFTIFSLAPMDAFGAECSSCHEVGVEKAEYKPVQVASIPLEIKAVLFKQVLESFVEKDADPKEVLLGRSAHLIRPYVPSAPDLKWIKLMQLKVSLSNKYHCPCPWGNSQAAGEYEMTNILGQPVVTVGLKQP